MTDARTLRRPIAFVVVIGLLAVSAALADSARAAPVGDDAPAPIDVVEVPPGLVAGDQIDDEWIVTFRSSAGRDRAAGRVASLGAEVVDLTEGPRTRALVRAGAGAVEQLRRDRNVATVESNRVVSLAQQDPPWGLDRVDQRELPLSGSYTAPATGDGVRAYVIDDGIWREHVDFDDRVLPGAICGPVDGSIECRPTVTDDGHETCSTHGSHIAGTIGGSFAGIAKQVDMVPIRIFDCNGNSTTAAVVAAVDWVIGNHPAGTPGVVNLSFGGPGSGVIDAAVADLAAAGLVPVAAAGNSAGNACNASPARSPDAITVGSTTIHDARSWFSNIGPCVDLFAPGSAIWSVDADGTSEGFTTKSGTSMATPHVAGAAALLLALEPGLTPAAVADRIVEEATANVVADAGDGSPNRLLFVGALAGDEVEPCCDPPPPDDPVDEGPGAAPSPSGEPSTGPVPPPNDRFAEAATLPVASSSVSGTNVDATAEPGEPDHAGVPGGASVWWRFTAPTGGTMTLSTDGSDFDTLLAVYTGGSITGLTEIAANDGAPAIAPRSEVTFAVAEGRTYHVAVDGRDAATGAIELASTWSPGFAGVGPDRLFDSRASGRLAAGDVVVIPLEDLSQDATGVVLNVTAVEASTAGYLTVFPCPGGDAEMSEMSEAVAPEASNVNFTAGGTVPNAVVSKIGVGPGGERAVCVFTSAATDVLVDVSGALRSGFTGLEPTRLLDTRPGVRAGAGTFTVVPVAGRAGVPADASGVVLNVTAVEAAAPGFVSVVPCPDGPSDQAGDQPGDVPSTSNLNYSTGQTVAGAVLSEIGPSGSVCVYTSAATDVLVDVAGAFGVGFEGVGPVRVLDSRPATPVAAGEFVMMSLAGSAGLDGPVGAVIVNVTAVEASAPGFVSVFPCVGGAAPPEVSSLNVGTGETVANAAITSVGDGTTICLYTSVATDLLVDVAGVVG